MAGLVDSIDGDGAERTRAQDCCLFLREFALFLYEGSPRSERHIVASLTVAMAKAAEIIEMGEEVIKAMSEEMQNTLKKGAFDEDGYLEVLAKWKEYDRGV